MHLVKEQDFDSVLQTLMTRQVLSLDTETTGLRWAHGAQLFSVIIADEVEEYYFDFNHWNDDDKMLRVKPLPYEWVRKLQPLLETRLIVGANFKFDIHFLKNAGLDVHADVYDVLVMARVENNTHFQYSLDKCAERIELSKSNKVEEFIHETRRFEWEQIPGKKARKKNKLFHHVPLSVMAPYACQDARVTYQLYQHQMKVFAQWEKQRPDNLDPIQNIIRNEMALTKVCFEMERIGFQLDVEYVKKALKHEEERAEGARNEFLKICGKELVDSNKSLLESIGDTVVPGKTEKGNASFNDEALQRSDSDAAKCLLEFRDARKRATSYYGNFLYHADGAGVVHCNVRQSATITGRFSISDPALQTLNAEDEGEWLVRKSFVARPGFRLLAIDYAAFEFRAMLDMANERELAAKIDAGLDPHQATADLVGISRKEAKTVNFGCIAEGCLVLTHQGLVPIEKVTLEHLVWDGIEYVSHDGVVYQGEKECLKYEDLWATRDHKIFTRQQGAVPFGTICDRREQRSIITTETNGRPIEWKEDNKQSLQEGAKKIHIFGFILQSLRKDLGYFFRQYTFKKIEQVSMSIKGNCARYSYKNSGIHKQPILGNAYQMQNSWGKIKNKEEICFSWYKMLNNSKRACRFFIRKLYTRTNNDLADRSYRQQWELRNWKYTISNLFGKCQEQRVLKTYDILNCGPRHRFTVSGFLVHNCLYGMGIQKLATALDVSTDEATHIRNQYFDALPKVQDFIKKCIYEGRFKGYVWSRFSRKYLCPDPRFAYKMPNVVIQGGTADAIKFAMVQIHNLLKDSGAKTRMIMTLHDELIFELHDSEHFLIPQIKKMMEDAWPSSFHKMSCTVEWSNKSWGELEPYAEGSSVQKSSYEEVENTPKDMGYNHSASIN